jgi:hypothetical protein
MLQERKAPLPQGGVVLRRRRPTVLPLLFLLATGGAEAGLRAHYPFDTGFTDVSGNNNHLTVAAGTPTITSAAGEIAVGDGAAKFVSTEADQHSLLLTSPITFSAAEAWSVAFWGRRAAGSTNRQGMIIGNLSGSDFIWLSDGGGGVSGMRFRNSSGTSYNNGAAADNAFPDDGNWHHWVLVADGAGSLTVYRDSVSLGTVSAVTTFNVTHVGQAFNSNAQSMNGQIDELYIFDEAIDAAMVGDLFGATGGPDTTPPTLSPGDFVDNRSGGPVIEGTVVTYTVTFSEAMDAGTVSAADFGNAGSAPVLFGAVSEISPGVFSVAVTPTDPGSLQLEVMAGAALADAAGNPLNTTTAIVDGTIITVNSESGPPQVGRIHVFLVGGQSNADGRASPSGLPTRPVDLRQPQEDVDFYENGAGGLTTLRPFSQFGPEITLGRRLADNIGDGVTKRIAIIKYATGGTSLAVDWKPGGDNTTAGDGPQYVSFQQVVSNGMAALAVAYPGAVITIDGIVWVQGERDAKGGYENQYEANLTDFIADVRATYGAGLSFIVIRLSSGQTNIPAAELEIVRAAQTAVAASDPRTSLVDTDGFGLLSDNLHFDALGQQAIGSATAGRLMAFFPFTSAPVLDPLENGDIRITVGNAFGGFLYTLQSGITLQSDDWADVDSVTATGPLVIFPFTPPAGDSVRFFRVVRTEAP